MLKGFRDFLMRGNVVDLAVAVVVGGAFGAVVTALVKDIITPLIAAIFGKPDFGALRFTVHGSNVAYGDFINAVLTFASVAAAVYFVVVVPMRAVIERRARPAADITTRECPECLSAIPRKASRCSFCTSQVAPQA